ncbi:hypothetical protein ZWY2020_002951 [Hordeum vulgare]|nr:hypothetical protein ZWY2020_002951 [Hordeum vulgare]
MLRGGLNGTRGFRRGHSPPPSCPASALSSSLRSEAKSSCPSSSSSSSSRHRRPPRALVSRSHVRRFFLEEALGAEGVLAGGLVGRDVDEGHIEALRHHRLLPRLPKYWCTSWLRPPQPARRGQYLSSTSTRAWAPLDLFHEWLHFFGLQAHHLAPNAIQQLAAFVVLCEGFVGIEPRVDLWCNPLFFKQQSIAMEKSKVEKLTGPRQMMPCGLALVHHRSMSGFPQMPLQESIKHWQKGFFYVKSANPAQDALNMPPFAIAPPTRRN